jgi:AcrR family transcriptional regulator
MLEAYYQVLLDEGLEGASIGKIAKRIDVHPSLLIHYFGTKEQMTIELVDYLLEVYYTTYGEKLEAIEDPVDRLRAILDTFFSVSYQQLLPESVFYACFYLSLRHPAVRSAFANLHQVEQELLEKTIAECMACGELEEGDPHELALAVKGMEAGFAVLIGGLDEAMAQQMGDSLRSQVLRLLAHDENGRLKAPPKARQAGSD